MLTYNTLRNTQKRPDRPLYRRRRNLQKRHFVLMALILTVWLVQLLPAAGACYARYIYPTIARVLTTVSDLIPFAVGDLFIALSIAWLVVWPFYARLRRKKPWRRIVGREVEFLLWIYVWFRNPTSTNGRASPTQPIRPRTSPALRTTTLSG